jgi:multicomponent Na+:H+ antiporter subunit D
MARLWEEAFWKPGPRPASASVSPQRVDAVLVAPIVFLVSLTVALTAMAGPVSDVTIRAAAQLLDRNAYIRAVLGDEVARAAR